MKPFKIDRRTLLRGTGTAVALPLLEAMLPVGKSAFAAVDRPKRFVAYYTPCGIHMQAWTPKKTGRDYELSPTLKPFEKVKEDLLVLSGLENREASFGGPGDHAQGTSTFITCTRPLKSSVKLGTSVDQVIAQKIKGATRFDSLLLGLEGGRSAGRCETSWPCPYQHNISWASATQPLPKETDPRAIYNRLFNGIASGTGTLSQAQTTQKEMQLSILDTVLEDARRLESKLGQADRIKMEEFKESLDSLERKIVNEEKVVIEACSASNSFAVPNDYDVTQHIQLMSDLMVMAFQCDLTRVQTFMVANGASKRNYSFLGSDVTGNHHGISHHGKKQENYDKLKKIDYYHMQQIAYFLEKLKFTLDVDGTPLLDTSAIFINSEVGDGHGHHHHNLPVLVAGKGNGYFDTGQHLNFGGKTKVANLFRAILESTDTPVNKFGDSNGVLDGIQA